MAYAVCSRHALPQGRGLSARTPATCFGELLQISACMEFTELIESLTVLLRSAGLLELLLCTAPDDACGSGRLRS
jgi:hypothetical protein